MLNFQDMKKLLRMEHEDCPMSDRSAVQGVSMLFL